MTGFLIFELPTPAAATDLRGRGSQTFVEEPETDASRHGPRVSGAGLASVMEAAGIEPAQDVNRAAP
jgi:hypothetical protein